MESCLERSRRTGNRYRRGCGSRGSRSFSSRSSARRLRTSSRCCSASPTSTRRASTTRCGCFCWSAARLFREHPTWRGLRPRRSKSNNLRHRRSQLQQQRPLLPPARLPQRRHRLLLPRTARAPLLQRRRVRPAAACRAPLALPLLVVATLPLQQEPEQVQQQRLRQQRVLLPPPQLPPLPSPLPRRRLRTGRWLPLPPPLELAAQRRAIRRIRRWWRQRRRARTASRPSQQFSSTQRR
mmetsp:Transcript_23526/g.76543  ORF Transcript_23526/g.76543 Transcript_23526/m.76543 type:complete len:239 (+) Transcript_23526:795-1511(+)